MSYKIESQLEQYKKVFDHLRYEIRADGEKILILNASLTIQNTDQLQQLISIDMLEFSDKHLLISFQEREKLPNGVIQERQIEYRNSTAFPNCWDHWYTEGIVDLTGSHRTTRHWMMIASGMFDEHMSFRAIKEGQNISDQRWEDKLGRKMLLIPRCKESVSGILNELEKRLPGFITCLANHSYEMKHIEAIWKNNFTFKQNEKHPSFVEIEKELEFILPNLFMNDSFMKQKIKRIEE